MKTILSLCLLLLMNSIAFSQYYFYEYNMYFPNNYSSPQIQQNRIKLNGIKEQYQYKQIMNGKDSSFLTNKRTYTQDGLISSNIFYNKKGKEQRHYQYDYEGSNVSKYKYLKKGKIKTWSERTYTDSNEIKESINRNSKGIVSTQSTYDYIDNKLKQISTTKKGKIFSRIVYQYYANGDKKSIEFYNKKNKLYKVTSYQCNDEGKQVALKDTVQVCKIEEHQDSLKIVSYMRTNEKGKVTKSVYKYYQDTVLVEITSYNTKEKINYSTNYQYLEASTFITVTSYNNKQLPRLLSISIYNKSNQLINYQHFNKEKSDDHKYNYNDMGLLLGEETYKNGMLKSKTNVKYILY